MTALIEKINYATKEQTTAKLIELGFTPQGDLFVSPGKTPVTASIYLCRAGYYCVDIGPGAYQAPIVWNGPVADWDTSDTSEEFIKFMKKHFPGWA